MSQLPEGWERTKLGNLTRKIVGGGTPSKNNPGYFHGDIPFMTVKDMKVSRPSETVDKISDEALQNSSAKLIEANTLIISTRMGLGKIVKTDFPVAINQDLKALLLKDSVEQSFFEYQYKSLAGFIESLGTGTTVKGIRLDTLKNIDVVVAPYEQQKRIADKLDSVLAKVEAAQARLDKIPTILKRFRQSVLAAAMSGELSSEYREDDEEFVSITSSYTAPQSWKLKSMNELSSTITSGSRGWAKYYSQTGSTFIRAQNIKTDQLLLDDVAYVDLPEKAEGKRTRIEMDDLLVTITGANVTKAARVKVELNNAYVSQHVALIKLNDQNLSPFVELYFKALNAGRGTLMELAYGAGKPGLSLKNIRSLSVAIPPIEELNTIVRMVEELFTVADAIEKQYLAAKARLDKLTQSILAKAFKGELV